MTPADNDSHEDQPWVLRNEAEHDLYEHFGELANGRTTLLIGVRRERTPL
ncbi:MAG: hypothetical protein KF770_32210 [Anaerolineae bacterium]|nr:hypothetical protein [Anaerolineae bacterium]